MQATSQPRAVMGTGILHCCMSWLGSGKAGSCVPLRAPQMITRRRPCGRAAGQAAGWEAQRSVTSAAVWRAAAWVAAGPGGQALSRPDGKPADGSAAEAQQSSWAAPARTWGQP
jgi:hypothetical protein